MKRNGLKVRNVMPSKTENGLLYTYENKVFNSKDLHTYKEKFNAMKKELSIPEHFEDNEWTIKGLNEKFSFNFPFEFRKELNNALKCFTLLELYENKKGFASALQGLRKIQNVIEWSSIFKQDQFELLEEALEDVSKHYKLSVYTVTSSFLSFYHVNDYCFYLEEMANFKVSEKKKNRTLPNYHSILLFDFILEDFISKAHIDEVNRFYPLVLWWKITRILPLRPIEFSLMKHDCLSYDESNKKFHLTVPRCKINSFVEKKLNVKKFDTIEITKEIYELVQSYQETVGHKEEYLLSYSYYAQFAKNKASQKRKYNPNLFWTSELRYLLKTFYEKVVFEQYGYILVQKGLGEEVNNSIEMIQIGDTRHFAFCSMMLQGFSPLTIARLGGHSSIHTQMSYHGHLETFADANVKILSEQVKKVLNDKLDGLSVYNHVFNSRENLVRQMMLEKQSRQLETKRKIEGGYCLSDNFPFECPPNTDCIFCPMFLLNLNDQELSQRKTKAFSDKTESELKKQVALLKDLFKENKDTSTHLQQIKSTSEQISRIIGQKSVVDAYQLKLKEIDVHDEE